MRTVVVLCVLMMVLTACEWGSLPKREQHDVFKDTLLYSYKTVRERAADCGSKPDSACTVVKMNYPEFKGATLLNDTIKSKLLHLLMIGEKTDTGINTLAGHFLKSYADFKKANPQTKMFYELTNYARVIHQDSALSSLQYGGYVFQGGAHGAIYTGFINWNPKANKEVLLKDILVDDYNAKLTKIAEGLFRKEEKLSDTSSLARDYFFKGNKFALNDNYAITPLGLRYIYNQYEIKPYAAGQTELFIPYASIKTLLRPNSAVAQFIRKNAGI